MDLAANDLPMPSRFAARPLRAVGHEPALARWRGYDRSGGLIAGDALAGTLRACCPQPISILARAIVERRVVCVREHDDLYLPMFQFGRCDAVRWQATLQTLVPLLDDTELALRFAEPNPWLDGDRPCDALAHRGQAVFEAARTHRFIVRGG